jgi:hypothetical protein
MSMPPALQFDVFPHSSRLQIVAVAQIVEWGLQDVREIRFHQLHGETQSLHTGVLFVDIAVILRSRRRPWSDPHRGIRTLVGMTGLGGERTQEEE